MPVPQIQCPMCDGEGVIRDDRDPLAPLFSTPHENELHNLRQMYDGLLVSIARGHLLVSEDTRGRPQMKLTPEGRRAAADVLNNDRDKPTNTGSNDG